VIETVIITSVIISIFAGLGLGLFYFGGLWWTVQRLPSAKHPALLNVSSFVLRTAAVMVVFFFISAGDWKRTIGCMTGFLIARFIIIRHLMPVRTSAEVSGKGGV